jgi:hypothetical protein
MMANQPTAPYCRPLAIQDDLNGHSWAANGDWGRQTAKDLSGGHMQLLTLGGVAGPILFSAVVIVSAVLRSDYSHSVNFISEVGAAGTPYAALMN